MSTQTRTDWRPTVRLATTMSILSALIGVILVRLADVPESAVVIGVMVVGCVVSVISSGHPRAVRPVSVRVSAQRHRSAA